MKLFVYKSLIVMFLFFIVFQLTINHTLRSVERKIENLSSKENIDYLKDQIREEIQKAIEKDKIIDEKDRDLLKKFIGKISQEIKNN